MDNQGRVSIRFNQKERDLLQDCIKYYKDKMLQVGVTAGVVTESSIMKEALVLYHNQKIAKDLEEEPTKREVV